MRLIDADKLRKDIQFVLDTLGEPTKYGLRQAMSIIDKAPTVDAKPVIRCKECKHAERYSDRWMVCRFFYAPYLDDKTDTTVGIDDFCSYGERKDG